MWAFPAALVLASFGPFAITAALWILADAPSRRLSRWWALGALLVSYVFVPVYAIRRSRWRDSRTALVVRGGAGFLIWLSGRVVGKSARTRLTSFSQRNRGVPLDWSHLLARRPNARDAAGLVPDGRNGAVMAVRLNGPDTEPARQGRLMVAAIPPRWFRLGFVCSHHF
jgi:hypothetical protein